MAVVGSPFCEHRKLRTSCAICKPAAALPAIAPERKYVSREARDEAAEAPREARKHAGPLLPKRTRQSARLTRQEAERAQAWWVKK